MARTRAYATIGETRLGYREMQTGELVYELAGHEPTLKRAIDELWRAVQAKSRGMRRRPLNHHPQSSRR